jgi:glycosyltransferase involved in cell wall biosynthesis
MVAGLSIKVQSYAPNGFVLKKEVTRDISWTLVTRLDSPVGWKLDDLFMRYGIMDRVAIYNRGMPVDKLWLLYAAANCFLLTSKAEGLALPLLEAMACRVTTVGTNHAAIAEHLDGRLGYLIEPEYGHLDPFGNGWRVWASAEDGIRKLTWLYEHGPDKDMLDRAEAYVRARTWEQAGQVLVEAIEKVKNGNA